MATESSRFLLFLRLVFVIIVMAFLPFNTAKAVDLPPGGCGLEADDVCLTFDDFDVYSLGLLQSFQDQFGLFGGFDFVEKPNEADILVINTSGNGTADQGGTTDIDDPFGAVTGGSGVGADNMLFLMTSDDPQAGGSDIPSDPDGTGVWDNNLNSLTTVVASDTYVNGDQFGGDPTGFFVGGASSSCIGTATPNTNTEYTGSSIAPDCMTLWDAEIAEVQAAIDNETLGFFFANNETGDSGTLDGQDLLIWAEVTLHNCDGINDGVDCNDAGDFAIFEFSGDGLAAGLEGIQFDEQTAGVDDILPTEEDTWGHVHSEICLDTSGVDAGAVFLGACGALGDTTTDGSVTVNQSLGQDEAGFVVVSSALNEAFYSGNYAYMTIDVRMSHLNNGGDVLWIGGIDFFQTCPPDDPTCNPPVPVPATAFLLGLGLLTMGFARSRRGWKALSRS